MLTVYILPVSGGGFVAQLGQLAAISGMRPDAVFACSGGNVSAYLSMAGSWEREGIFSSMKTMSSDLFVRRWLGPLPSGIVFPITGSLYDRGSGLDSAMSSLFTTESSKRTEIWTGAYDNLARSGQLFTNVGESIFDEELVKEGCSFVGCLPPIYMNGDLKLISEVCYSSAAMPFFTQPGNIQGRAYSDGGCMFSSPLMGLSPALIKKARSESLKLRLIYFEPYDMDTYFDDVVLYGEFISILLHSAMIKDRSDAIEVIRTLSPGGITFTNHFPIIDGDFDWILQGLQGSHCLISLYHSVAHSIDITSFTPGQLIEKVREAESMWGVRIWKSKT